MARVLLFGRLADLAGWREREMEGATISAIRETLCDLTPALRDAFAGPSLQVALDRALVRGDAAVAPASEVAFLPPMSGG